MPWQFHIDRGGTFTDIVARDPAGQLHVRKLLTRSPRYEDATAHALAEHVAAGRPLDEVRLGTTVATNALLERRGERVLLLTTRGFADLLEIGFQARPDIFALHIEKRALLHEAVVEIDERVMADGRVLRTPDPDAVRAVLQAARATSTGAAGATAPIDSLAVLLLHSCVNPAHELLVERIAREVGFVHVALSHRVSPEPGAVARGDTTVADAYLTPLLRRYLRDVAAAAPGARVRFMQSSGGLADGALVSGKDAILSGPAGGAVAVAHVAERAGLSSAIGFDMGGTSTDVCRWAGEQQRVFETVAGGVRLRAPAVDVITVAAGGGSVLHFRDGRFSVGPDSAGADPGPACYGRGGPATLTDANLVLGRILPEHFPHLRLDAAAARAALETFCGPGTFADPRAAAAGFVAIANDNMAAAIRAVSVARGHDVRDDALVAFGGAAGQHACAVARLLGARRVIAPPFAGVLSAWGLMLADVRHHEVAAVPPAAPGASRQDAPDFPEAAARAALQAQDLAAADITLLSSVDARYLGTDHAINVPWSERWQHDFVERHRAQFGFVKEGHPVELLTARVEAVSRAAPSDDDVEPATPHDAAPHAPGIYRREDLQPGAMLAGPAVIVEDNATTVVDAGWRAHVDGHRNLVLEDGARDAAPAAAAAAPTLSLGAARDPVGLEVMSNRFMAIATQMGEHLRRLSHSTNIKERLDYSCALFDAGGGLIANAPHIPVHLGAMGETVAALLAEREMRDGDVWLTNDPFRGGSHLPDLTVITPVFRDGRLAFLVGNRGHHADVGGPTPGSMPADSRTIADEGVLFSNELLLRDGQVREAEVRAQMEAAGVRGIDERLADLRAQIASNAAGARLLGALCDQLGLDVVQAWMGHVRDNAEEVMRDVIAGLLGGESERVFRFEDGLDDGARITVTITARAGERGARRGPDGARAIVDFAGSSGQHAGNRNAPRAVTVAAVLYVFRTLAARAIPLNAGCLRPLEIRVPPGSLLDPRPPAAVAGGNVETSQRIVDVLYGALGSLAASQGTMNNVTFGDGTFGYYETICGGAGAGPGFDGASAVHTHMTNTRITDVEVLERRFPVMVEEFSVRRGSGGAGRWRGGDGVVRAFRFLRPLRVTVLAERRSTAPFGLGPGAGSGARGEQHVTATSLRVVTPGGGGFTPGPASR